MTNLTEHCFIGLVHRSQMSNTMVDNPDEVVTVGEHIYCKVISAEVFVVVTFSML